MTSVTPDSPRCPLLHVCLSWLFCCWPCLKYWCSVVLSVHPTPHLLQWVRAPNYHVLITSMALKMIYKLESVFKCPDLSPALKQDLLNCSMGMSHIHLKLTCLIMNPWAPPQDCSFWWLPFLMNGTAVNSLVQVIQGNNFRFLFELFFSPPWSVIH